MMIVEIAFADFLRLPGGARQFALQRPARRRDHLDAHDQEADALSQRPVRGMPRQRLARIEPVPEGIAIALRRAAPPLHGSIPGGHVRRAHHELFPGNWRGIPLPASFRCAARKSHFNLPNRPGKQRNRVRTLSEHIKETLAKGDLTI
jgi:hypothetical protein